MNIINKKSYKNIMIKSSSIIEINEKLKKNNYRSDNHIINKYIINNNFDSELLYTNIINNSLFVFADQQKRVLNELINFIINKNNNIYIMTGYAGTGKTSIIGKLISYLIDNNLINTCLMGASTNKAVLCLKDKIQIQFNNKTIDFKTIHLSLKYKLKYTTSGEKYFMANKKINFLTNYDIIIFDECSMANKDILLNLLELTYLSTTRKPKGKIILLMDPLQLPPVNEENNILYTRKLLTENDINDQKEMTLNKITLLNKHIANLNENYCEMTEIIRNKNNDINDLCNNIRLWILNEINLNFDDYKSDNIRIYKNEKTFLLKYCNKLKKNEVNDNIILAWRNEIVNHYNNIIRQTIFNSKNLEEFEINDLMISCSTYKFKLTDNEYFFTTKSGELHTSEQFIIKFFKEEEFANIKEQLKNKIITSIIEFHIDIQNYYIIQMLNIIEEVNFIFLKMLIRKKQNDEELSEGNINNIIKENTLFELIYIIPFEMNYTFKESCDKIMNILKTLEFNKNHSLSKNDIEQLWEIFYYYFSLFADITYGYAMTIHKSQGSTFHDVFINIKDVLKNKNIEEAKKCCYTALTRSSNKINLFI